MSDEPTNHINLNGAGGRDGALFDNNPEAPASTVEADLKTGDRLAAAGQLEKALAIYRNAFALWAEKRARGSSLRAADQVDVVLRRIGDLGAKYLLRGNFERARECAEEALAERPKAIIFNLTRAHALMFLGQPEEARAIYARFRGKSTDPRILRNFTDLRQAGLSHPLMDEVEVRIGKVPEAPRTEPADEPRNYPQKVVAPPTDDRRQEVAAPPPGDIELGDKSWDEGNLKEAYRYYFRALMSCRAKLHADPTDLAAQQTLDVLIPRIGELAFEFLLARDTKQASQAIAQALRDRPQWLLLQLIQAHVLMLSGHVSEASRLHSQHYLDPLEDGEIWGHAVRDHFAQLRAAGWKSAVMDAWEPKA